MIWLFERGEEVVQLTTRFERTSGGSTILIVWADGRKETERYRVLTEFHARVLELQHQFDSQDWRQVGSPTMISSDWRGPVA